MSAKLTWMRYIKGSRKPLRTAPGLWDGLKTTMPGTEGTLMCILERYGHGSESGLTLVSLPWNAKLCVRIVFPPRTPRRRSLLPYGVLDPVRTSPKIQAPSR
jgi:hypothetical protein